MLVGKQLGQFKVIESLGKGGMGEVFRAQDLRLDREVALKVLPSELAENPERRQRFEREARAVATLNHPNIVTIYSVDEVDEVHFFTMELIHGQPLSDLVPEGGLETLEFCRLAADIAAALEAAHKQGVLHRDLKPANVMVTREGRIKVLDFGLAKLRESASDDEATAIADDLTQVGKVLGTASYMSPEQAEGKIVDNRSDIFSLGVLFYLMATGEKPFQGDTQLSVMSSILKDDPTSVTDLRPGVSQRLNEIIFKCLEKDPARRYSSCQELRDDIIALKQNLETDAVLATRTSIDPVARQAGSSGRWTKVLTHGRTALVVVGLLAILGVSYLGFQSWERSPEALQPPSAFADQQSLAVFYFQNLSGDPDMDWLRTGLTEMLVTDLAQSPNIRVLSTERLHQLLQQMDRLDDRQTSLDTVQSVARVAQIGTAIVGSFAKLGDTIRIEARLLNTESGDSVASERVSGEGQGQIFSMVDELTRKVLRRFQLATLQVQQTDRDLTSVTTDSVEAYRHYVRGIEEHELGDDEAAIPFLERAVELDSGFAMAYAKLSVALGNTGRDEEEKKYAKLALDRIERLSDRERYYIQGRYYSLDQETREEAKRAYSQAVEIYPDHSAARHNLAMIFFGEKKYELAAQQFEQLRQQGMTFPSTHSMLASSYEALDQPEKGLEVLREYVEAHPNLATSHRILANYLSEVGKYSEAVDEQRRAREIEPGGFEPALWDALVLSERWDEALEELHRAQEQTDAPLYPLTFAFEGVQALYFGRIREGVDLLKKATEVGPEGNPISRDLKAAATYLAMQTGNFEEALEMSIAFLADNQSRDSRRDLHFTISVSALVLGREELAAAHQREFETLATDEKGQLQGLMLEAIQKEVQGDTETAIEKYRLAEAKLPDQANQDSVHAVVWFQLGEALHRQRQFEEAAIWFEELLNSGKKRVTAPVEYVRSHFLLGSCYQELGETAKAREHFERFLFFWKDGEIDHERIREAQEKLKR